MKTLNQTLGETYKVIQISRSIVQNHPAKRYPIMDEAQFKNTIRKDLKEGMRIYYDELLMRIEYASIASLKRQLDWIDIIETSQKNFIGYCAGLRGLIESCGDSYHGLHQIALTLAQHNKIISNSLEGQQDTLATSDELEELVLHFTHATKNFGKSMKKDFLEPKRPYEYVKLMESHSNINFYSRYEFLCSIVHPASTSLAYNFEDSDGVLQWNGKRDAEVIKYSLELDKELFIELLFRGFNPSFLILKTLAKFNIPKFTHPEIESLLLDKIPAWNKIEKLFV